MVVNPIYNSIKSRFDNLWTGPKLRRRQLTDTGDVEITGRDLREKPATTGQQDFLTRIAP